MRSLEYATNEVIILGGGMEMPEEGSAHINIIGKQRADRFIEYYNTHNKSFGSKDAQVICSGGYGLLAAGIEQPEDKTIREGILTADYLVQNGIPHQLINVEDESISTLTNFTESMDRGYIRTDNFDADHRLGIVSHRQHLKRAVLTATRLGFAKEALALIATRGKDSAVRELALRSAYRALFVGAYGPDQLLKREHLPEVVLGTIRRNN